MLYFNFKSIISNCQVFFENNLHNNNQNMNKFAIFGTARSDFGDMVGF